MFRRVCAIFLVYLRFAVFSKIDHGVSLPTKRPLNIAHRGSSGMLPEHTLAAYELAVTQGADVIECDACITKDLQIVCLHDSWLNKSTNVMLLPQFADRVRTYYVQDEEKNITDWFSVDFTLDELKTIKKVQTLHFRSHSSDSIYSIASMEDFIQVAKSANRPVGLHIETKHPRWVNSLDIMNGTSFEDLLAKELKRNNYYRKTDPCFIQSFEEESLRLLVNKTNCPLVMLFWTSMPTGKQLEEWSKFCYGVGPWKDLIIPSWNADNGYKNFLGNATNLINRSHELGMKVHAWTFRNEDQYLAWDYGQDPYVEFDTFVNLGVDGMFTDFPNSLSRYLNNTFPDDDRKCTAVDNRNVNSASFVYINFSLILTAFVMSLYAFKYAY